MLAQAALLEVVARRPLTGKKRPHSAARGRICGSTAVEVAHKSGRAGSRTLRTLSTAIGDSSDEYCDTTLLLSDLQNPTHVQRSKTAFSTLATHTYVAMHSFHFANSDCDSPIWALGLPHMLFLVSHAGFYSLVVKTSWMPSTLCMLAADHAN